MIAGTPHAGDYIAQALATEGGHLSIGRGGFTLHLGRGSYLSGYDSDTWKHLCAAAGLPVIDSRTVPFDAVGALAVHGPMPAVGEPPSTPPWGALSFAPLQAIADAYRAAGADVLNLPPAPASA
jgi:hypothetical protein